MERMDIAPVLHIENMVPDRCDAAENLGAIVPLQSRRAPILVDCDFAWSGPGPIDLDRNGPDGPWSMSLGVRLVHRPCCRGERDQRESDPVHWKPTFLIPSSLRMTATNQAITTPRLLCAAGTIA